VDLFGVRDYYGSLAMAKEAVALDPSFAMAHLLLAQIHDERGDEEMAYHELAIARQGVNHLSGRERHLIQGFDRSVHYDDEGAAEEYRVIVEQNPSDIEALRGWASALSWTAQISNSLEIQRRITQLSPNSAFDYSELMHTLVRLSRFNDALKVYQAALSRQLDSPGLRWDAGTSYLGMDDIANAQGQFELLSSGPDEWYKDFGQLHLAAVLLYQGRPHDAEEILTSGPLADESRLGSLAGSRFDLLAHCYWLQGRFDLARSFARKVFTTLRPDGPPLFDEEAGLLAVEMGDLSVARMCLGRLQSRYQKVRNGYPEAAYYSLKGAIELASGDSDAAIEDERRASSLAIEYEAYLTMARAYKQKGVWDHVVAAYQRYLTYKGPPLRDVRPVRWVLANLDLARAYDRAGNPTEAQHYYEEFLRIWAHGDPGLPMLRVARAEHNRILNRADR
jgi:tetratricopeptide (TPR) repeat protein